MFCVPGFFMRSFIKLTFSSDLIGALYLIDA
jgi:hypothetical protein